MQNPVARTQFGVGDLVAEFQQGADVSLAAEDWTASDVRPRTSRTRDTAGLGRVRLSDNRTETLAHLIRTHALAMLGTSHISQWGDRLGVLTKLFNPDRRIPIHCHPTGAFAQHHLGTPVGKTEAWLIVKTDGAGPNAWLGFQEDVTKSELRDRLDKQTGLIDLMNALTVQAGDVLVVPAGQAHAVGPGVLLIEPQEASDWSVIAEYAPFGIDRDSAELGLGTDQAVECFDRSALTLSQIESTLLSRGALLNLPDGITPLAEAAWDYFHVEAICARDPVVVPVDGPCTMIVLSGRGELTGHGHAESVEAGDIYFIPGGLSDVTVAGDDECTVISTGAARRGPLNGAGR